MLLVSKVTMKYIYLLVSLVLSVHSYMFSEMYLYHWIA